MAAREFLPRDDVASSPAGLIFLIAPSNDPIIPPIKAVRANTVGTITYRTRDMAPGDADVVMTLAAGERIDAFITVIKAAGTSASLHGFA